MTPDVLYHYCSTETLLAIVQTGQVRLSSLRQSNDHLEGRLLVQHLYDFARQKGFNEQFMQHLVNAMRPFELAIDGLALCLSSKGDLLSQWRGYGGEARGASLGFDVRYLRAKERPTDDNGGLALLEVQYDLDEHRRRVEKQFPNVQGLVEKLQTISPRGDMEELLAALQTAMLGLLGDVFALKSPAFREEAEWRLIRMIHVQAQGLGYRATGSRLIPFATLSIRATPNESHAIRQVILGPRHETPPQVVKMMLEQHGFPGVEVTRSVASFR